MITLYDHLDKFFEGDKQTQSTIPLPHVVSELMEELGYSSQLDVHDAMTRAFEVCCTLQISIPAHFKKVYRFNENKMEVDWQVSDLGCYLLLINGNSCNPNVAMAQIKAIVRSRRS